MGRPIIHGGGNAGRLDDLFAVSCAAGDDPFCSMGIEACNIAVGCLNEGFADERHFEQNCSGDD